jgi:ATP/ADP translocase
MIKFLPPIICAILAFGVGRNIIFWAFVGYFLGFWALLPMVLLPIRHENKAEAIKIQEKVEKFKKELKGL